jgi:endo-1,4-beta-xylanase
MIRGTFVALGLCVLLGIAGTDEPRWTLSAPLFRLAKPTSDDPAVLLDPAVVRHDGKWHLFAGGPAGLAYWQLDDFKSDGPTIRGRKLPLAGAAVPQVYFHRPTKKWHLIGQMSVKDEGGKSHLVPCLSTNDRIDDPDGWSKLTKLDVALPLDDKEKAVGWMDFYVIHDGDKVHMFGTSSGRLWRSETRAADFPQGWSKPTAAIKGNIVYASHTYRLEGDTARYRTTVTSSTADPKTKKNKQYQVSYIADKLEGPWTAEAATSENPYAGPGNIRVTDDRWSGELVHGEPLRKESDERMILQHEDLGFVFHARARLRNEEKSPLVNSVGFLAPIMR